MGTLKRKMGPLQLWQWILIGAIVGGGTLLWRRGHPAAQAAGDVASAAVPSDAEYNPIDPTTGLPIAGGVSAGALGTESPQDAFASYLSNLETLLSLVAPTDSSGGGDTVAGDAVATDPGDVSVQTGAKKATPKKKPKKKPKHKKTTHAGASNPGHNVTSHGNNKKTASSSAPHNPRQHHHAQPPAHQRHDPKKHHSAGHLVATKTGGHGHVPTAHPPAKKAGRAYQNPALRGSHPKPKRPKRRR